VQSYKIYINERPLIMIPTDSLKELNIVKKNKILLCPYNRNPESIKKAVEILKKTDYINKVILHSKDFYRLVADFELNYPIVVASGGLIRNEFDEYLFIFRKGHWDLPKGKIEKNEGKREGAIREVMEETGIKKVKIIEKIGITYHLFKGKGGRESIKKSHWYLMETVKQKLKPQVEEYIESAEWRSLAEMSSLKPMYKNISDILKLYQNS